MTLQKRIEDWRKYPNALGSEAQVATIVGEVAAKRHEPIPAYVKKALKVLALRGTMRDIAPAIQRNEDRHPEARPFPDIVDVGATACGLSWTESIAAISRYFADYSRRA